ncbi:hypothetical protein ACFLY6_00490 [Candidatus Dependentiae bacterium]
MNVKAIILLSLLAPGLWSQGQLFEHVDSYIKDLRAGQTVDLGGISWRFDNEEFIRSTGDLGEDAYSEEVATHGIFSDLVFSKKVGGIVETELWEPKKGLQKPRLIKWNGEFYFFQQTGMRSAWKSVSEEEAKNIQETAKEQQKIKEYFESITRFGVSRKEFFTLENIRDDISANWEKVPDAILDSCIMPYVGPKVIEERGGGQVFQLFLNSENPKNGTWWKRSSRGGPFKPASPKDIKEFIEDERRNMELHSELLKSEQIFSDTELSFPRAKGFSLFLGAGRYFFDKDGDVWCTDHFGKNFSSDSCSLYGSGVDILRKERARVAFCESDLKSSTDDQILGREDSDFLFFTHNGNKYYRDPDDVLWKKEDFSHLPYYGESSSFEKLSDHEAGSLMDEFQRLILSRERSEKREDKSSSGKPSSRYSEIRRWIPKEFRLPEADDLKWRDEDNNTDEWVKRALIAQDVRRLSILPIKPFSHLTHLVSPRRSPDLYNEEEGIPHMEPTSHVTPPEHVSESDSSVDFDRAREGAFPDDHVDSRFHFGHDEEVDSSSEDDSEIGVEDEVGVDDDSAVDHEKESEDYFEMKKLPKKLFWLFFNNRSTLALCGGATVASFLLLNEYYNAKKRLIKKGFRNPSFEGVKREMYLNMSFAKRVSITLSGMVALVGVLRKIPFDQKWDFGEPWRG